MFSDNYVLYYQNGSSITIDQKNLAWKYDRYKKYKLTSDYLKQQWQYILDEHFLVWMRPAPLSSFMKLWGRINQDLYPGKFNFSITNTFHLRNNTGLKAIKLSTTNIFGGQNNILAYSLLLSGTISFIIAIIIIIGYFFVFDKKES